MHTYTPKTFTLPTLPGLSEKQIKVHLGLYEGYVKNINILREQIHELEATGGDKFAYAITETRRRLGFEFNGMRMHEYYFEQLEGGSAALRDNSKLAGALIEKYGSIEKFMQHLSGVGMSRGIGWAVLYADPAHNTIHTAWVSDHELGQLGSLPIILAIDMWEHAFMVDYIPSEKKNYLEAFLKNINWSVAEQRYETVA